jgi:thymidylate synthase (FAD)
LTDIEFSSELKVEFLDALGNDLEIARAAWVSTQGERIWEEANPLKVPGLINYLMRSRHGSPFEQGLIRFRVNAPIVVFREHHRHRIASYNEMSGRYIELPGKFYVPAWERPLEQVGKPGHYDYRSGTKMQQVLTETIIKQSSLQAWRSYQNLLSNGVTREVARMVLPLNLYSTMIVAMNPRAMMNFLSLRVKNNEAQYPTYPMWEIDQVAKQYESYFAGRWPDTHEAFVKYGRVAP